MRIVERRKSESATVIDSASRFLSFAIRLATELSALKRK
jgi:hypothetical protein